MTRFSVPISNILGLSFYRYELTSSTYNATIDTSFTITCKVTDVFGNNVNNKTITLYHDGSSISNATTNSNGIATWTITPSTWGIHDFNVSNKHIQINVTGFKQEQSYASGFYTLSLNGSTRTARAVVTLNSTALSSGENYKIEGWVPSQYRPVGNIYSTLNRANTVLFYVTSAGNILIYNTSGSTVTLTSSVVLYWDY